MRLPVESATPTIPVQAGPDTVPGRTRKTQLAVGLGIAVAILVAAWLLGVRSGFDTIGSGGVNQSLLPKVGQIAPDFTTQDLVGNPASLSQFRGEPVWLMFWGSWCPPCRAEFPDIQRAYEQLAPEGVHLLGVSIREEPLAAAAYAAQNDATFLVLSDPDETDTGGAYPLFNVPTHIFIDADGVIRSIILSDMDEETALREARKLFQPATAASS